MWTCEHCGRSFANRNQSHACQTIGIAEHLAEKTELAGSIYEEVTRVLRRHGEFREHPQKGGIGFISRMTFAGVALRVSWVDLFFLLPRPLDHKRVRKLELYGPTSWAHTVRIRSPQEVDDEVGGWLEESLRRGNQETLDPRAEVEPLTASQLAIFWTGFRGRCVTLGEEPAIRLPVHVADALGLVDAITVRIAGIAYVAPLLRSDTSVFVLVDRATGIGEGDQVDVFITGPAH
jgi:hypothetical protein